MIDSPRVMLSDIFTLLKLGKSASLPNCVTVTYSLLTPEAEIVNFAVLSDVDVFADVVVTVIFERSPSV